MENQINTLGREITIVSTRNQSVSRINSDVKTWGELKTVIEGQYDLDKLKAVLRSTKAVLEFDDAVLPDGPICIMLRPSKNKGGACRLSKESTYKELKDWIKENPEIKPYLKDNKIDGRNWTQFNITELYNSIQNYLLFIKAEQSSDEVVEEEMVEQKPEEVVEEEMTVEEINEIVEETLQEDVVHVYETENNPGAKELQSFDYQALSTRQKLELVSVLADAITDDVSDAESVLGISREESNYGLIADHIESIHDDISSILVYIKPLEEAGDSIVGTPKTPRVIKIQKEELPDHIGLSDEKLLKKTEKFFKKNGF